MLSVFAESQLTGISFARSGDSFSYLYTDAEGTRLQIFETQFAVSESDLANCRLGVSGMGNRGTTKGSWRVACTFAEAQQDSSAEPAAEPVAIEPAADSPEAR